MPVENTEPVQTVAGEPTVEVTPAGQQGQDPFDEKSWSNTPPTETPAPAATTPAPAAQSQAPATTDPPKEDDTVDADQYLKDQLQFDNWETAKAELTRLRDLEKTAQAQNGKGNIGKEAIRKMIEEKEEQIFSFIDTKRKLSQLQALEPTNAENAARILKADMQLKNPQLTASEVDFKISRQYRVPTKPIQGDDETDGDFSSRTSAWEQQVKDVEQEMMIEAKVAKPGLLKHNNELEIPDIPIVPDGVQAEPTAEELQRVRENHQSYLKEVEKGVKELKGIDVEYKDDEYTIPLNYKISPEEQKSVKAIVESLYTDYSYLEKRWQNEDGSLNTAKLAKDIHLLENSGRIFEKLVKESATQRLDAQFKKNSNIEVNGGGGNPIVPGGAPDPNAQLQAEVWK